MPQKGEKPMNLMEGLISEMNRVRESIKLYDSLPDGAGMFGSALMKVAIKKAEKSITDNDTVEMLRCYKELQGFED